MSDRRILGQSRAVAALTRATAGRHVHHAWIFHGPFGVGKCTTAMEFARLLLDPETTTEHIARFAPPRGTNVDNLIAAGSHPDLHVIRKERAEDSVIASLRDKKQTNIPVDLLRELMLGGTVDGKMFDGPVWKTPYLGHGKVFIIDEAELLDSVGQNALLKTLEEPPAGTVIILVTTREDRLLPTIRSRCQRVAFAPLDDQAMQTWLASSNLAVDADARQWIERFAEGSPGLAVIAAKYSVADWARELAKPIADLSRGIFIPSLSDRMADLIGECAEAALKENSRASKEAANRLGTRLLFGVLGRIVRDEIRRATDANDAEVAESWSGVADVIADADEQIRRHLNLKQVLALLVARWVSARERVAPRMVAH
jgi:DNA polymerase III subunit delta'